MLYEVSNIALFTTKNQVCQISCPATRLAVAYCANGCESASRLAFLTDKSELRSIVTTPTLSIANTDNPFDRRGPFLLSLLMTLVGYSVLVALPAINGAWVDQLGFSDVEVNRVASADLLGLFLGAVITSVLIRLQSTDNY